MKSLIAFIFLVWLFSITFCDFSKTGTKGPENKMVPETYTIGDGWNWDYPEPGRVVYRYDSKLGRYIYRDEIDEVYGKKTPGKHEYEPYPGQWVGVIGQRQTPQQRPSAKLHTQEVEIDGQIYEITVQPNGTLIYRKVR